MGPLILLDRDGVLNAMVIDPEHGTIDSPLHPDQVRLIPGVPEALARLTARGFRLAIVTNQPSASKGKTTRANLEAAHARVLELAQAKGGRIERSEICFHRSEDLCECRKPKPGMLLKCIEALSPTPSQIWMVGDGVTDLQAGRAAGTKVAFLGPRKCDQCKVLDSEGGRPDFWGTSLAEFTDFLTRES